MFIVCTIVEISVQNNTHGIYTYRKAYTAQCVTCIRHTAIWRMSIFLFITAAAAAVDVFVVKFCFCEHARLKLQ